MAEPRHRWKKDCDDPSRGWAQHHCTRCKAVRHTTTQTMTGEGWPPKYVTHKPSRRYTWSYSYPNRSGEMTHVTTTDYRCPPCPPPKDRTHG